MTANGSFNAQGTINTDGDYIDASLRLSPRCDRHIRDCSTTIISDGETIRFFGDFSGSTLSSDMVGSFPKPPDDDEASCFGRPASGKLTIIDELKAWIWDAKWNGQGPVFMVKDIRLDLLLNGVEGCIQIHDADHYRPRSPEFDKPPLRLRDYIRPRISHEYNGVTLVERFDCSLEIWNGDTLMKVYEHAHPSTHLMLRRRNDLSRKAEEIMQTSVQNFRDDHTSSVVTIDPAASISVSDQPKSLPRGFGRGKFMAEGNPSVILCPRCVSGLKDAYFELDLSLENLCDGCSLDHYLWQLDLPPAEGVQHQFVAEAAEMVMLSGVETFYYPDNRDGLESYGTWRQNVMNGSDPYITFPENTLQFLKTGCEITRISYSLGKTVDPSLRSKVIRDFVSEPFFKYVVLNKEICAAWPIVRITREFISGKCQEFIAESNEEIGSGLLQKIIEGIRGVSGATFADVIEKILKIFTGYFSSLISVMSETINSFWNDAIGVLRTWFVRFFDPLKMIQKAVLGGEGFANYVMFFGIIITLFVSIFGLLSGGLAAKILLGYIGNRLSPFLKDQLSTMLSRDIPLEKRYVGEANPALAAVTVGIVGTVIGNTTKADNKKLNDFCRNFISLVSFGTVVTGSITALFLMLPGAFQRAVIYRYGTSEQKAKLEYEQWRNQAEALMKIHQIPSVLTSGRFREVLDKVLKDAHLIEKGFGSDNTRRLLFVAQLGRLQAINSNLTQYERMHGSRAVPFSIHLYGRPGAGKSTIAPKMAMEVTGHYGKENIYTKSMDEFWTGYIAEKIVLIDEFLATNDSERRTQQAKDYLGLISSQQFIPDMPSISNVTQGIKGTSVAPDMVITMNNTAYDVVTNLADPMALQRRRNFVVEIVVDPNAKKLPHSKYNVDVKAYTEDERQAFSWLKFVVRPGESSGGKQIIGTFDYPGLITFLRNQYNEMREANDMIAQMTGTEGRAEIDVNRLIDQTLMEFEGIPTENISLLSIVWRSLKGEGGKRTRMKKRQTDPFKDRIKPEAFADYQRPICGLIYSDSRLTNADVAFLANLKGPFLDESYEKILRLKERGSSSYDTASEPDELGLGYCSADDPERHLVDLGTIHGRNHVANLDPTPPLKLMEHPNPQPMINETEVIYNEDSRHNMYYQFPGETTEQFHDRMGIYLNSALKSYVIEDKRQYLEAILSKLDSMVLSPGEKSQLYESYEVLRAADPFKLYKTKILNTMVTMFIIGASLVYLGRLVHSAIFNTQPPESTVSYGSTQLVGESRDLEKERNQPHKNRTGRFTRKIGFKAEAGKYAQQIVEIKIKNLTRNCNRTVFAMPIKDRTIMSFAHGWNHELGDKIVLEIRYMNKVVEEPFYPALALYDDSRDIMFYSLMTNKIALFPNNLNKFLTDSEFDALGKTMAGYDHPKDGLLPGPCIKRENVEYLFGAGSTEKPSLQTLEECVLSNIPSSMGFCGLPLVILQGQHAGKIVGIHVAGSVGKTQAIVQSVTTPVTREYVLSALENLAAFESPTDNAEFVAEGQTCVTDNAMRCQYVEGQPKRPNIDWVEPVKKDDRIFVNRKTKLQPSIISDLLPPTWKTDKEPAVLSMHDHRSFPGLNEVQRSITMDTDPILRQLADTGDVSIPDDVDLSLVREIADTMFMHYQQDLKWPIGKRVLSFEEALAGVPGQLASVNLNTSPGWPLVTLRGRSRGKRDFVTFDQEGQLTYTQEFKTLCDLYEDSMLRGEQPYQHKFLGFLKDELVRKEKIENARTRIIYCNDFVATTVYRKYLGALLCAFQSSYETTASSVGINQFSFDMDNVYEWLTFERTRKVNFQAGDYKDFDKRHVKIIREYCYDIIRRLNGNIMPEQAWNIFYRNETKSPAQMGDILVKFKSNHYSGNFFTTVLNNLVNEFYHRYVFKRHYPNLIFDDWIRIKVYGDDHILGIDKGLVYTGPMIQKGMMELGQVYTSDKKGQEIVDYQNFEDVTFLGAQMRYLDQYHKWTGAIKLDIIHQTLMWTRDNDRSIEQTVDQMLAYLSQHERITFELYADIIIKAMEKAGYDVRLKVGYSELQRIVATRSVGEDYRFYGILEKSNMIRNPIVPVRYVAEVQPWEPGWNGGGPSPWDYEEDIEAPSLTENPSGDSLTTFHDVVESTTVATKGTTGHLSLKVAAKHGGDFGTESAMYRTNVEWNNTQVANHTLASWLAPKDFLALGEPNNVQNIGFQNYIYWEGEIEVIVQVSGTQWQQGLAMLYFQPLSTDVLAPYAALAMALPHVLLSPCDNSSKSLRVPFRFPRSVLNSYSMLDLSEEQENLGRFFLQVISPLQSIDNLTSTITIYTRFPNSKFTIPRPLSTTRTRQFHARHKVGTLRYPYIADIDGKSISSSSSISYIAEGNTYSQNSTSTTYDIHDVVGGVPVENSGGGVSASAKGGNDISASAEVVPMDNPPLVGGTFPISGQYGSMSKVTGPELTVGADLHRERMCRQHKSLFDQEELKIAWLASRWSTIVKDTSLNYPGVGDWAVGDDENTILYELPLTSVFMTIGDTDLSLGKSLGHINQAFINMFTFWRADIEFKISIVGTPFHAGKLRATIGYGAPVGASGSHQNIFYNQIFTFDGSNSVRSFVIPYNAATQFLYTYMGPNVQNPVQDFSLGTLTISVANRLKAPESVMQKVNVLLSFRYHNVRVAVPRVVWPYSGIPTGEGETPEASVTGFIVKPAPTTLKKKIEKKKTTFVAESNPSESTVGLTENKLDDKAVDGVAEVTEVEVDIPAGRPCKLHLGAKFEYLVTNVIDVFRRGRGGAGIMWNTETQQIQPFDLSGPPVDRVAYFIENKPHSILNLFFAAWAGTLRYRIHNFTDGNISNPSTPPRIAYFPAPPYVPAPGGAPDAYVTLALGDGSLVTYPDGMSIRNGAAQLTVGVGNQNIATMNSVELLYPTANGQSWIDYSVPFDSIFDYAVSSMKRGTGIIVVGPLPKETSESTNQPSCWQMFGDDFEFGVFRVPIQLYYAPFYHTSAAVAIHKTAPQAYY